MCVEGGAVIVCVWCVVCVCVGGRSHSVCVCLVCVWWEGVCVVCVCGGGVQS